MNHLKLFSGTANPSLTQSIADYLKIEVGNCEIGHFSDGEISVNFKDSVRGKDVFVVQPTSPPINEHYMELFITIDALKRASAKKITAVIPYYGYGCQEKKDTPREPITAKLVASFLEKAGADRIITMDLHAAAIQGFFDIPVDHLTAIPIWVQIFGNQMLAKLTHTELTYKENLLPKFNKEDIVFVSADEGRAKHVRQISSRVGAPLAICYKFHPDSMVSSVTHLAGDVKGKIPIIIEDMIRTGGSIIECAKTLLDNGCKPEIYVAATHGLFTNASFEKLGGMPEIKKVFITDTVPLQKNSPEKFVVVSTAYLFAEAIKRIRNNKSISSLYD